MRTFARNRCTSVEQRDERTITSTCRLQDTLIDASVQIEVKLPDLEVTRVTGSISRSSRRQEFDLEETLQKVVGIRVGPGMKKIIKGVMGEGGVRGQLAFMVEECCSGVILSFTKDVLVHRPKEKTEEKEFYAKMVRENPRLYNRCAAYAPGSSLVEGLEPPK